MKKCLAVLGRDPFKPASPCWPYPHGGVSVSQQGWGHGSGQGGRDARGSDATLTAEPPPPGSASPEPCPHPVQARGQVHGSRGCPSPGPPGVAHSPLGKPTAAPGQAPGCREDAVGGCRGPAVPPSPCHLLCMKVAARNFILTLRARCVRELLRRGGATASVPGESELRGRQGTLSAPGVGEGTRRRNGALFSLCGIGWSSPIGRSTGAALCMDPRAGRGSGIWGCPTETHVHSDHKTMACVWNLIPAAAMWGNRGAESERKKGLACPCQYCTGRGGQHFSLLF